MLFNLKNWIIIAPLTIKYLIFHVIIISSSTYYIIERI